MSDIQVMMMPSVGGKYWVTTHQLMLFQRYSDVEDNESCANLVQSILEKQKIREGV